MKISKLVGLIVICFLMACGGESETNKGFQGTITLESTTDMVGAAGLMGGLLGDNSPGKTSQTQQFHIDVPKTRVKVTTTINSENSFQGLENLFTTIMVDFNAQYVYLINEDGKQYVELPTNDLFTSNETPSQIPFDLTEISSFISKTDEEKKMLGYNTNRYEIDMPIPLYKIEEVYLSPELFNKIKPILHKIPFLKNVISDLPEVGWPMSVQVDIMGIKSSYKTTKVEEHEISEDVFSLEGYELISFVDYSSQMMEKSMELMKNYSLMENFNADSIQAMHKTDSIVDMMEGFMDQIEGLDDIKEIEGLFGGY